MATSQPAFAEQSSDALTRTRETLLAERMRLLAEAAALAGRESQFNTLEGSGSEDADLASDLFEKELAAMLGHGVRVHLMDIDAAIARIDTGQYGTCEECGEEIDPERLEALPRARRCLACQRKVEFKARR
jgi:DnaK suppressor protein